ncbi:MAG: adenosine kinase [Cellvibrionales bacterium]|nr:adenosine kinase [Cellvibrionales bacterium]
MKQYDVYGIGNALVDTEINTDDAFLSSTQIEKGLMTLVDLEKQNAIIEKLGEASLKSKRSSGGSAANSIIAVSEMGGSSYYSCQVAKDEMGEFYLNDLNAAGVDCDNFDNLDPNAEGITGKCLVMITPDAERTMNTYLGISETLSSANINFDALTQSKWFYTEGYLVTSDAARTAVITCKQAAEKAGVKTAISLSDPSMVEFFKEGLLEMIGTGVDLLFANEEEAIKWTGEEDVHQALSQLTNIAKSVVITLGAEGAIIYDGLQTLTIDPVKVNAIDTNGAGDAFAGAFLYAINNGYDYQSAGKIASATAAKVVSQYGARLKKEQYQALASEYEAVA